MDKSLLFYVSLGIWEAFLSGGWLDALIRNLWNRKI
jgi:hypothetical protein